MQVGTENLRPEAVRVDGRKADGGRFCVRAATAADIPAVVRLDEINTGLAKPDYWRDAFARYGARPNRFFLVADEDGRLDGFIVGEVRAWEFGSPPCGWIIALGVDPGVRLQKVGSQLFEVMCEALRGCGVDKVRTMLARDDDLNMAFFRSQGMWGGPFIQLEKPLG
jgi:ribosomal protein S18 acetylase RimI-like enzyme